MSTGGNPWMRPAAVIPDGDSSAPQSTPITPPWRRPALDAETGGVPRPTRRLRWWRCPRRLAAGVSWWAVGVHGGAGATRFVSSMAAGGYDVSQHWPVVPLGVRHRPLFLLARTDQYGLSAAQDAIREYWWSLAPPTFEFAGLVLMADSPAPLPDSLRDQALALAGGVPNLWHIPWVPEWRAGRDPATPPVRLTELREQLPSLASAPAHTDAEPAHTPGTEPTTTTERTLGRSSA